MEVVAPPIFWIDLFCGAGGTTSGIHMARANAKVVACVNHDEVAIQSHKENHKDCLHLTEDIKDERVINKLKNLVDKLRREFPNCVINIWASLECTNYSKAKGGLPRDADSRTLAIFLYKYLEALNPDYLYIENVREFMSWGPLNDQGRPVSRKNGADYVKWCNHIQGMGYDYDYRILNAADFGAFTSRIRYFGQFALKGHIIKWPEPTHVKKLPEKKGLFTTLKKKWRAVREVLDLEDEGVSIFMRKKPLSENTLKRIMAGLVKFVANGQYDFTKAYNSGNDDHPVKSIDEPIGSLTTQNSHAKVKAVFMKQSNGGDPNAKVWAIDQPSRTLTTTPNQYKVEAIFLSTYYQNGSNFPINGSAPTLTTKDRVAKIHPQFFLNHYSGGGQTGSIDNPAPTVMGKPKTSLTSLDFVDQQYGQSKPKNIEGPLNTITANSKFNLVKNWLVDTQYNNTGHHIDKPCPTIIARQDKKPMYVVNVQENASFGIAVFEGDSPMTIVIKRFMAQYGIIDIKMRMLKVPELLRIQGFPKGYKLKGTKTQQKKFIGNSVVPIMAQAIVESNAEAVKSNIAC